ncbi:glycosyltransferase family 2 protein [Bradyrhizobium diazoefficiens]|uniref:glycosyltransferase family A protein n=1 Tax=Bradyrhizobium diazoefficiens TaxID=1355477 RepID=UPI001B8BFD43|nr:glycosyltransferase family A protein [Bradyrhizobium diazoefficiens]MBR0865886.1 glycosyltransferase family 2 protein [Bradyrhizobium diazoefficiens]MBR0890416.1 glycosyltransferase family 2 protein [Bradyrhizobium diazoefficiens]MBR0922186.1 glycosyltransferase family 2 protein [Bradyrhizobium diazoefficiens]
MTTISFVIISREAKQRLALCIAAVGAHQPAADEVVIVLDDPTTPEPPIASSATLVSEYRIVRGRGQGRAAARNDGARAAHGDALLFLDGDMLTASDLIAQYVKAFATSRGFVRGRVRELLGAASCSDLAVGGPGFPAAKISELRAVGFSKVGYRTSSNLLEQAVEARFIDGDESIPAWIASAGANFMIARDIWIMLGGQNECFGRQWGCEDLEFSYRASEQLGTMTYAEDAVGYHLSHSQPDRWVDHKATLDLFVKLHSDRSVRALSYLLASNGSLDRYRAALREIDEL